MDVGATQSATTGLIGTWTGMGTRTSTGSNATSVDVLDLAGTAGGTFSANDYTHLNAQARAQRFNETLQSLPVAGFHLNAVAQLTALSTAAGRQDESRNSALTAAAEALSKGDPQGARKIAEGLLKKNGRDAAAAHMIGRSYLALNNYPSAEYWFSRAASLAPTSTRFRNDLDNVKLLQKTDNEVLAEADRLAKQPEQRTQAIRVLGYLASRSKGNAEAHIKLGDAMMQEGYVVPAFLSYQNALAVADDAGSLARLVERLKPLAAATPDIGLPHNLLGHALRKQGNHAEALAELKKAAEISPVNESYRKDVGLAYGDMGAKALQQGNAQDAIRYYENALEYNASSGALRGGLALAHAALSQWWLTRGNIEKAFAELSNASTGLPSDQTQVRAEIARAYNNLGDRYEQRGDIGWAIASYQNAHNLAPDNTTYRSRLGGAYDAMGTQLFDAGDYEAAEGYYQQAVDLYPGNKTYQAHLQAAQDAR